MNDPSPQNVGLAEKLGQWREVLDGEDPHSINSQLGRLTWDAAAYRMINEARRMAAPIDPANTDLGVQLNGMHYELLDRGFFVSQMVAIRRLCDAYDLDGDRGVYSLSGLLKDIGGHRHLLTRGAIFQVQNFEYDDGLFDQMVAQFHSERRREGKNAFGIPNALGIPRELCGTLRQHLHERIDFLTGVDPANRHPNDQLEVHLLDNLKIRLSQATQDIKSHVDKFIAHAASPASRALVLPEISGITLGHLWDAQKRICEVTGFVSLYILGGAQLSFLPIPQFDQFEYFDRPLVDPANTQALPVKWDEFHGECQQWGRWGIEDYQREFSPG